MNECSDREAIIAIVEDMAKAQSAEAITKAWHDDAVWYDIQFCEEKGLPNSLEVFRKQFALIQNIRTKILDCRAFVDGNIGFVHSVQHFECDDRTGKPASDIVTRQTDCFVKTDGEWRLMHQHVSLPINFETGKAIFKSDHPGI